MRIKHLSKYVPLVAASLLAACGTRALTKPSSAPAPAAYLFTSFRGEGDGLHLAFSHDGLDWTDLDRVFLKPSVGSGLLRDPHLLRDADGLFHLVWTSGANDLGVGYASSPDLVNWSEQRLLPLMAGVPGAKSCHAPELYRVPDTGEYALVWSGVVRAAGETRDRSRIYYSLTRDFKRFTTPRTLLDINLDAADPSLVYADGQYQLFYTTTEAVENGRTGALRVASSPRLLGPYEPRREPLVSGDRPEGPAPLVLGDRLRVFFGAQGKSRHRVRETLDGLKWTDLTPNLSAASGQRHGSVVAVPATLAEQLRLQSVAQAGAPTPALPGYTADPAIRVFGDRYYIYPTADRPFWNTTEFAVWSSPDLVSWKKDKVILDLARGDVSWAKNKAWAPDCIERDGRYYFYFCGEHNIGVAVGDSPVGPFREALGRPLVEDSKIKTFSIDPHAFIDDDGQAYLYFGNGTPTAWRLNRDMISFSGEPVEIALREFREGVIVFKRAGRYYFMWSIDDARSPDYRVGWGVADKPFGPVASPKENFIVLRQNGSAKGTAHHSVVNVPGTDRWYVAYHRHAIPGGGGYKRETVLVRMNFDAQGNILPMDPMQPAFPPGDIGEPLANGRGRP